jgi:hypothetical protein
MGVPPGSSPQCMLVRLMANEFGLGSLPSFTSVQAPAQL